MREILLKLNDLNANKREAIIRIYGIDGLDLKEIEVVIDRKHINSFLVFLKYEKVFRQDWKYKEKEEK